LLIFKSQKSIYCFLIFFAGIYSYRALDDMKSDSINYALLTVKTLNPYELYHRCEILQTRLKQLVKSLRF